MEARESSRNRLERTLPQDHKDHIAENGFDSLSPCNLAHKIIPMPQAMRILDAKAQKVAGLARNQSKERKGGHCGSTKREITVHFATLMDICHLKSAELEPLYPKYLGQVVLRGDVVKDGSGSNTVFTEPQMTAA